MFPYIELWGDIKIPLYLLCFLTGAVIAVFVCRLWAPKLKLNKSDVLYCFIYTMIGIGVGAKLFYILTKIPKIIIHWDVFVRLMKLDWQAGLGFVAGGLTFYGGLIGAVAGFLIYFKQYKMDFRDYATLMIPWVPFVHAFGRVGCFMAGCCYGMEYYGPFAIRFPYNEFSPELNEVPRFPVQLLEALVNFCIFAVLIILSYRKKKNCRFLAGVYCVLYSIARFFLEMLRGDLDRGTYGHITTSQIVSVFVFALGWVLCVYRRKPKESGV